MFWKKKKKLPITTEDQTWIDEELAWLKKELSHEHFMEIRTVTPTKNFYNRTFDGSEQDAEFILKCTMELMKIEAVNIKLNYFSDSPIEMDDGTLLSTPADISGEWQSAAGTYESNGEDVIIFIERSQLKDPISLIATISHELSHEILLGENRIAENDEYLTDLTAITYGFGIFIGNSRFNFSRVGAFGWQSKSSGYLPEQIIAYTMAKLSQMRNESTDYVKYLDSSLQKYFKQSEAYLAVNKN